MRFLGLLAAKGRLLYFRSRSRRPAGAAHSIPTFRFDSRQSRFSPRVARAFIEDCLSCNGLRDAVQLPHHRLTCGPPNRWNIIAFPAFFTHADGKTSSALERKHVTIAVQDVAIESDDTCSPTSRNVPYDTTVSADVGSRRVAGRTQRYDNTDRDSRVCAVPLSWPAQLP
jgi:hypothetical protein